MRDGLDMLAIWLGCYAAPRPDSANLMSEQTSSCVPGGESSCLVHPDIVNAVIWSGGCVL